MTLVVAAPISEIPVSVLLVGHIALGRVGRGRIGRRELHGRLGIGVLPLSHRVGSVLLDRVRRGNPAGRWRQDAARGAENLACRWRSSPVSERGHRVGVVV